MIVLGKIVEPYGIAGWVRVHPFADDMAAWGALPHWWLSATDQADYASWRQVGVSRAREANGKLLAKLEGIEDRTAAEGLKGWFVAVPKEAMPAAGPDEYYWDDLVGLAVENAAGEPLGEIRSLMSTGANDVMVVAEGKTERLIPFVAPIVQEVSLPNRRVVVAWERDW